MRKSKTNLYPFLMIIVLLFFSCIAPKNSADSSQKIKGYSVKKLDSLKFFLEKSGAASMIVLVDGEKIFEWGNTAEKHIIHSIRKPLIHALIGIAVTSGTIDTSMTLKTLHIQDIESQLSDLETSARIADLLKSRSGVYHQSAAMTKKMLENLPERNSFKPGEHYFYNNWDFNTLGTILEQETGEQIYNLFENQIAKPLGMVDFKGNFINVDGDSDEKVELNDADGYYKFQKSKSKYPAYHFRMSSRDLALFGQLYLSNGIWKGKQIVPEAWIKVSMKPYSIIDEKKGIAYGMLWKLHLTENTNDVISFYHTGLEMQILAIYPRENMVVVHRVNTEKKYHYDKADLEKTLQLLFDAKTN